MRVEIYGTCAAGFEPVRQAFAENFTGRGEIGASVAVAAGGKTVVNLWGGWADPGRSRPWQRDTLTNVWSTTKAMTSLCAHILIDRGELDPDAPQQALHGDAGGGNLMATDRGWFWHDFEDTCSGPVAWDLAASTSSQYQDGPRILAAYREPVDPGQLAVCEQLRRLHLTVWYNLYAERLPELGPRAAELLASWPAG